MKLHKNVRKAVIVRMIGLITCYALVSSPVFAAGTAGQGVPILRDGTAERPSVTSGIGRGDTGKASTTAPLDNDKSQNSSTR